MPLVVIGDVHGKFNEYKAIADKHKHTVQLGDFGFYTVWNRLEYSELNSYNHKVLCGNHDDYDIAPHSSFSLSDYGTANVGGISFFFIRGGLSIDKVYRVGEELGGSPKTWWSKEELTFSQMLNCIEVYKCAKPDIVISHVPPACYINSMHKDNQILRRYKFHDGFQENTALLGNELLKVHRPKLWISGHHHISHKDNTLDGVSFVGLAELETYEIGQEK